MKLTIAIKAQQHHLRSALHLPLPLLLAPGGHLQKRRPVHPMLSLPHRRPKNQIIHIPLPRSLPVRKVHLLHIDLTSLASVREFADEIKRRETKVNILVNNAGVMMVPVRTLTKDGFTNVRQR